MLGHWLNEGHHIGFQFRIQFCRMQFQLKFQFQLWQFQFNSNSNDGNSNSIPIQFLFQWWQFQFNSSSNDGNSNSIPIPEFELELAINSNSGAELTPALTPHIILDKIDSHSLNGFTIYRCETVFPACISEYVWTYCTKCSLSNTINT